MDRLAGLVDGLVGFNEEEQTVYDIHKRSANFRYVIYPHMHLVPRALKARHWKHDISRPHHCGGDSLYRGATVEERYPHVAGSRSVAVEE